MEVRPGRSTTLALRWLVTFARQRREKTMVERLANELLDASNGLGASVKRREDTHKMAEANKRSRTTAGESLPAGRIGNHVLPVGCSHNCVGPVTAG